MIQQKNAKLQALNKEMYDKINKINQIRDQIPQGEKLAALVEESVKNGQASAAHGKDDD